MRIFPEDDQQPSEAEMQAWEENPFHDHIPDDLIRAALSGDMRPSDLWVETDGKWELDEALLLKRADDVIRAVEAAPRDGYVLGTSREEVVALIRRVAATAWMEVLLHWNRQSKNKRKAGRPVRYLGVTWLPEEAWPELYRDPYAPPGKEQRRFEKYDISVAYEIVRRFRARLFPDRAFKPYAAMWDDHDVRADDAVDADAALLESVCKAAGMVIEDQRAVYVNTINGVKRRMKTPEIEIVNRCSGHVWKLIKGR